MKKTIFITLLSIISFGAISAAVTKSPDFAYPQKVAKQAESDLTKALADGNGQAVADALIRYGLARTSVSNDNFPEVIAKVENVIANEQTPATRSILNLLLADLYSAYYTIDSYNRDSRTTVAGNADDITLWSGEQFKDKIGDLCEAALADREVLKTIPLDNYSDIIKLDNDSRQFYPTLFDFASHHAMKLLTEVSQPSAILPRTWLIPAIGRIFPPAMPAVNRQIITIADNWVAAHAEPCAARVAALLGRFDYLQGCCITDTDEADNAETTALTDLYEANITTPSSVEFLLNISPSDTDYTLKRRLYALCSEFVANNPSYFRINAVKEFISNLTAGRLSIVHPRQVGKGIPFTINVNSSNVTSGSIIVYRIPDSVKDSHYEIKGISTLTKVSEIPFTVDDTAPFSKDLKIKATIDTYGRYIIVPQAKGLPRQRYYDVVGCSNLAAITAKVGKQCVFYTADITDGRPVGDVKVTFSSTDRKKASSVKLLSDSSGRCSLVSDFSSARLTLAKGSDTFAPSSRLYLYSSRPDKYTTAFIRTSLPVYHPGDSVRFVAVAYSYDTDGRELLADTDITSILFDANHQPVDTLDLRTDRLGRINGTFLLPESGLTGNFSINLMKGDKFINSRHFLVSDYKLPTFEVNAEVKTSDTGNADRTVTISGKANAYSGFPTANAKVSVTLNNYGYYLRGWNRTSSVAIGTFSTETSATGEFEIGITPETLASAPYPEGGVTAEILVTSPTGENRFQSVSFPLGKPYSIRAAIQSDIDASSVDKLNIGIYDITGNAVSGTLNLIFKSEGNEYRINAATANGIASVDLSSVPSGRYTLTVTDADGLAPEYSDEPIVIYRPTDKTCHADKVLWVPVSSFTVSPADKTVSIIYGTNTDNLHILLSVSTPEQTGTQKWITAGKGLHRLDVDLPENSKTVSIVIATIRDLEFHRQEISVNIEDPADQLKINVENFRDRIVPQSAETVTLRITDGSGRGIHSALVLDMYAKSIDAIASSSWKFNPTFISKETADFQSTLPYRGNSYSSMSSNPLKYPSLDTPGFNTYGRLFGQRNMIRVRGSRMMAKQMSAMRDEETESAEIFSIEDHAAPAYGAVLNESVTVAETGSITDNDSGSAEEIQLQYRPSEIPLAFFAPDLTTDDNGNLSYSFTVPNANTSWMLNILAYDHKLNTALDIRQIVASKPVMVQPNLPRFLRQGDKAELLASVMNNSDRQADITTVYEILNPTDLTVIFTDTVTSTLLPSESTTLSFPLEPTGQTDAVIVRIKSSTDSYSDGEQILLPILPSEQTVTDSRTFYLAPDSKEFHMDLPTDRPDAVTTLSFCENPTWEVVTALPGLSKNGSLTATDAAASLFSAAVATGLLNDNPAVAGTLRDWLDSSRDNGTLLSMLDRNNDLKRLMLSATPWVTDAANDTERMTRLALLFDRKATSAAISSAVTTLGNLETAEGGWAWSSYFNEPSEWVTMHILNILGRLNELGYLPADKQLNAMIARAISYIDKTTADRYARYPKSDFTTYTYIRGFFPGYTQPTSARAASNAAIQQTVRKWEDRPTTEKAVSAIILYRANYKTVAKTILASLREFATTSPEQGMWWDSVDAGSWWSMTRNGQTAIILDAFRTVEPASTDIDSIRQWLILNKQVQDWGNSINATQCVAAILRCGSSWLSKPGDAVVTIGNRQFTPTDADRLTGAFVTEILDDAASLTISRSAESPAWGAVMTRYTGAMTEIEASSLPELSVSKETLVQRDGQWIASDTLAVGDIARIRLIVTSTRDMDYVTVTDQRAATLEPVIQTPRAVYYDGVYLYLENRDSSTNLFIRHLPKGQFIIEYDMNVNNAGLYSSGVATIQSHYTPEMTAHSAGTQFNVANLSR